ncbi:MAG: hypothetical protein WAN86_23380 [Hyphomicrobiaceae bacterium]
MDQINEFVDERQKGWCIHCGGRIADLASNRDHAPSKSLLLKPYPANLPVVQVCMACNNGFSRDEEYLAAFLGAVLSGSTEQTAHLNPAGGRILGGSEGLKKRIERSKVEYKTIAGETRLLWKPEQDRINRVVVKNARGHAFFEYGEAMLSEPDSVWWMPLQVLSAEEREEFENTGMGAVWPEVGSRMLTRALTGQDLSDGWVMVQERVYRYAVMQADGLLVRSVLSEYLATEVHWGD